MEEILLETVLKSMEKKEVIVDNQHGSSKGKLCLTNLVNFYDGFATVVDEGRVADILYLDLCQAFDTVWHNIPVSKLERHGFDGWATWWLKNWLNGNTQRVAVNSSISKWRLVVSLRDQRWDTI